MLFDTLIAMFKKLVILRLSRFSFMEENSLMYQVMSIYRKLMQTPAESKRFGERFFKSKWNQWFLTFLFFKVKFYFQTLVYFLFLVYLIPLFILLTDTLNTKCLLMFLSVLYEYVDLEKNLEILTSIFKEGGLIEIQIKGRRTENLRGS